jgi:hypothetical protein
VSLPGQARDPLVAELERRIEAIEGLDEARFGAFTPLDWVLCVLLFLVVPHLLLWWFS